jgi:hypothetical protein
MTNNIVPISQQINSISQSMRERMKALSNQAFTSNVSTSYPLLSIRGKEFTFRLPDGRSQRHEQNGFAMPFLDVVLVEGSPLLSKTYYEKGFDPNEFTRPDCWSLDSVKPDPSSPKLQAPTCAMCPQNMFGSRVTPAGKKAKACSDYRRVVVLLPHQIGSDQATPMALRVPQSSLKNLKAHGDLLANYGVNVKACITRLSFTNEAFPQLLFTYVNILTEPQWDWVAALSQSTLVQGMVNTPDFENATSTPDQQTPGANKPLQPLPAAPVPEAFSKLMETEEAEVEEEDEAPASHVKPSLSQPIQPSPMPSLHVVPTAGLIALPDGTYFNPATGEYVDAPAPKVEMPELDPDTITLPDNRYYNQRLGAFVTGPEKTAVPVQGVTVIKAKPPKPRTTKPKPEAEAAQAAPAEVVAAAPAPIEDAPKPDKNNGVKPAPAALDDVLREVMKE